MNKRIDVFSDGSIASFSQEPGVTVEIFDLEKGAPVKSFVPDELQESLAENPNDVLYDFELEDLVEKPQVS